ncbi:MAG: dihydrolipoamide acetyltransferase family protein [Proteobacteria bacterium]|nr:dihydrolipoamide acetyltransferase family protein [Pseudomonadota bacterium]MDA0913946.1 dihydrolipoamide acetyltransferase family protein [Pseudomonadota bacterium]MDA1033321.1 dihydrolipoamide acetyltransferase family protein [Pseudomonadota bacterium]
MAKFTFNMPDVGEGVAEAEIVEWHVKVGDTVSEDQHLVDVMTDKATIDIESPVDGVVTEVAGEVGDVIAVGAMLVAVEVEGEVPDEVEEAKDVEAEAAPKEVQQAELAPQAEPEPTPEPELTPKPSSAAAEATEKVLATPAVRKRARDLGIDLSEVKPAEDGRIRHGDLDQFLAYNAGGGFAPAGVARTDETIKVIGLRKRIAQNMSAAKRNIPHFTYVEECDVTELERMRAQLNSAGGGKPKLTMLPLLIAAICKKLPQYPMINARYDDEEGVVTRHGSVHLGMATQTDNGLMVPVVKDAQAKNLWQLANEIGRLANSARDGSAKSDELSGSTLTVTSLGPLGGVATTPVINRPEVAIIGPNRIVERPMFVTGPDGQERIERRKLMNISISCDHRVVDGYDAASFIQEVKKLIETPVLLLSE